MMHVDVSQLLNKAIELHRRGRQAEAKPIYKEALRRHPNHPQAMYLLAVSHLEDGDIRQAESLLLKLLKHHPDQPDALYSLGKCRGLQKKWEEAASAFHRTLNITPQAVDARIELIKALMKAERKAEAEAALAEGRARHPDRMELAVLEAEMRVKEGDLQAAADSLRQATTAFPNEFSIFYNLGRIERKLGFPARAADCYRHCLTLKPTFAPAVHNLGNCLKDLWDVTAAVDYYKQAAAMGSKTASSSLLMVAHYLATTDWQELSAEHKRFGETFEPLPQARPVRRSDRSRLRVGFVSGDLGRHPVGYMLWRSFPRIDRKKFSLHCYVTRQNDDEMAAQFAKWSDAWVNIAEMSDRDAADLIRRDGIDVLIDLAGHTHGNRLGVFALRPARVQMTGFGYVNTSGLRQIDYILTDEHHIPQQLEHLYVERALRLPAGRFCYDLPRQSPDVAPTPCLRTGHPTFGCFNNLAKINDFTLDLWTSVLAKVPNSRLLIKAGALDDPSVAERMTRAVERRGIGGRVTLAGRSAHAEYLETYASVDVCLDPFPFGGGLTTLEALWMGVPVVSLAGPAYVSRQGLSILSYAGLPNLVATTADRYVDIAADLVSDPSRLDRLRFGLRKQIAGSPLCDGSAHARGLEAAIHDAIAGLRSAD